MLLPVGPAIASLSAAHGRLVRDIVARAGPRQAEARKLAAMTHSLIRSIVAGMSGVEPEVGGDPALAALQSTLDAVPPQLARKAAQMETQIAAMETDFLRYASLAHYQYCKRIRRQRADHARRMSASRTAIQGIRENFGQRLAQEVALCAATNARLRREVQIQERVNAALQACAPGAEAPGGAAAAPDAGDDCERRFEQARLEINAQIARLESENAVLGSTMDAIKADSTKTIALLQSKLEGYNALKKALAAREAELAMELADKNAKETELSQTLAKIRSKRLGAGEILRSELASLCSRATTLNAIHARQLNNEEIRVNGEQMAHESEIHQLKCDQEKELRELQKSHMEAIERIRSEGRSAVSDLEAEIAETIAAQERDRTRLETRLAALRGEPAVCEPAMPSARRKRPGQHRPQNRLSELSTHFENESSRLCDELTKGRADRDERVRAIRDAAELTSATFEKEKMQLTRELKRVEGRAQQLLCQTRERFQEPRIVALLENIAQQQKTVGQLRDEMERSRVPVPKRRALLGLQQQRNKTIAPIRESIDQLQMKAQERMQEVIVDCSQRLAEAALENEARVRDAMHQLAVACHRWASLQKKLETANVGNFHKWRELRTELGTVTVVPSPPPMSPLISTHQSWVSERLSLPPLRPA
jgi:hypothetical protein